MCTSTVTDDVVRPEVKMAELLLSDAERTLILHGVQDNSRTDGRQNDDYRSIELETDVVSNSNGSAKLRLANTAIMVAVKAEIGEPSIETPNQGRIEFFVDCCANATPEFEGSGGEELAQSLSNFMARAYASPGALDLKSLSIITKQQCWLLYIDILVLECGGNLHDAVSIAVKAALFNTKIPNVRVTSSETGEMEMDISDDPYDIKRLDVTKAPVVITLNKIGSCHIVDATGEEEACSSARLLMAVTPTGQIAALLKHSGGSLHPDTVQHMMESGKKVGKDVNKQLLEKLKEEEDLNVKKTKVGFLR